MFNFLYISFKKFFFLHKNKVAKIKINIINIQTLTKYFELLSPATNPVIFALLVKNKLTKLAPNTKIIALILFSTRIDSTGIQINFIKTPYQQVQGLRHSLKREKKKFLNHNLKAIEKEKKTKTKVIDTKIKMLEKELKSSEKK